jgi:MFS family permease
MTGSSSPEFADPQSVSLGVKVVILAGGPAISLAISLIQPLLPSIEADLAHSAADSLLVKMLVGVMGVAMVIGASATGFLVDRFGLKRVMAANYALYALAGTAGIYLDHLTLLVCSRFFLGIAASGAVAGSIIIINTCMSVDRRPAWLGYYVGVAQFTALVLNPVSGMLGNLNWHWSFALYGVTAPFAFIARAALPGPLVARPGYRPEPPQPLRHWFPFSLALLSLVLGTIIYIPAVYLPFLLSKMGMVSPALISFVLTGDLIMGAIAALLYGRARRLLSGQGTFLLSVGMVALGLLIAALAPNFVVVVVGCMIFGLGVPWFIPNLMVAVANRVSPEQQGRAVGLVKGANYLGSPIAVFLTEPISREHGARGALLVASFLSLSLLLTGSGAIWLRRRAAVTADREQ